MNPRGPPAAWAVMCMNNCAAILPYLISPVRDEFMRKQVQNHARSASSFKDLACSTPPQRESPSYTPTSAIQSMLEGKHTCCLLVLMAAHVGRVPIHSLGGT